MFSWLRIAVCRRLQEQTHATISTEKERSGTEDGCYSGLLVMIGGWQCWRPQVCNNSLITSFLFLVWPVLEVCPSSMPWDARLRRRRKQWDCFGEQTMFVVLLLRVLDAT